MISHGSLTQGNSLGYMGGYGSHLPVLNQNQLISMLQNNMYQQVSFNNQNLFFGFPNFYFNGFQ